MERSPTSIKSCIQLFEDYLPLFLARDVVQFQELALTVAPPDDVCHVAGRVPQCLQSLLQGFSSASWKTFSREASVSLLAVRV
jgi:hypothetical protein